MSKQMKGLNSPSMIAALSILTSLVISYVTTLALLSSKIDASHARASSVRRVTANSTLPDGSIVEVITSNSNCRRVIGGGYPLLSSPDSYGEEIGTVNDGQRVGLINGSARRRSDGELFVQVAVPYGVDNPDIGFMPAKSRRNPGANLESTLGICITGYWGNGNQGNNNSWNNGNNWGNGYPDNGGWSGGYPPDNSYPPNNNYPPDNSYPPNNNYPPDNNNYPPDNSYPPNNNYPPDNNNYPYGGDGSGGGQNGEAVPGSW